MPKVTQRPVSPAAPTASPPSSVTVKAGDSLSKVAQRAGVSVDALVQANVGRYPALATNRNAIQVGWSFTVPGANTTPAAPEAPKPNATWAAQGGRPAQKPSLLGGPAVLSSPTATTLGPAKLASPTIAGVKANATEVQFQGLTGANPLMTKALDVQFGKLTAPQFDALKAEFGGLSQVKYDAAREYSAVDFLPPTLQALVNRDLDTGPTVTVKGTKALNRAMGNEEGGDLEIGSTPNCHGTAWEAMRAYQGQPSTHVNLLYGDGQLVGPEYDDAEKFTSLGRAQAGQPPDFLASLKPGDAVSFSRGEYELLHSAIYVGGGLFFEKPNTESDESPYRLVTLDQAVAPIQEFIGEAPTLTALRPKQPLPSGLEAFTTGEDAQKFEAWAAKKGQAVGKPLVREFEVSMGGGIRGLHFNAAEVRRVEIGADGRGVIR